MSEIRRDPLDEWVRSGLVWPRDEIAIDFIVKTRQLAFRTVNAFPTDTKFSPDERTENIKLIPPLDAPDAIRGRLGAMVMYHMLTLDLARIEGAFDWRAGADVDESINDFLFELDDDRELQRQIGVVCLEGPIAKKDPKARTRSTAHSLGAEFDEAGVFHVVRVRRVAALAIRGTHDQIIISKRADFATRSAPKQVTRGALELSRGGLGLGFAADYGLDQERLQEVNLELVGAFNDAVQCGIDEQVAWLKPQGLNYYAARKYNASPGPKN